jgi:hypothetical protein
VCKWFICVAITIFGDLWNITTDVEIINKRMKFYLNITTTTQLTRVSLSPNVGSMTLPM